ncbi:MAG: TonB-dependent receptor [Bacteroidales bacterium]|nr:TonB-dependent receptor [Bacteroidales bacterium]
MKRKSLLFVAFAALLLSLIPSAVNAQSFQTLKVTGKVTASDTGEPIIAAGVQMKASSLGTITDVNGDYAITVTDPNGILTVSAVGFKTASVNIGGRKVINVTLDPDAESLEDAVVIGYGTQKKATITGSLTTVDAKLLTQNATPSLSNALGGIMPGVITRQSSGEPGYDGATILIRGLGTWVNASPLILVDGVERDINIVNTEEIESFSILKDASATAVYGMRGANGVVLITTKKGQAGKPKVTFRSEQTHLRGLRFPNYIEGWEFATLMNEACTVPLAGGSVAIPWTDEEIETFRDGSDPYNYPSVNWTDEVLKKNAFQSINNLSVSGGNETIRYYVSLGFTSQSGLFKEDPTYDYRTNSLSQRYNFRSNIDVNLTKNFSISLGLAEIIQDRTYPGTPSGDIFNSLRVTSPISFPLRNPDGTFGGGNTSYEWVSPYVLATNSGFAKQFRSTTQGTVGAKWDLYFITPGLQLEGNFSYDHYYYNEVTRNKTPEIKKYLGVDPITGEDRYTPIKDETAMGYRIAGQSSNRAYYYDLRLNYNRSFNNHNVGALAMFNRRDYKDLTAGNSTANLPYRRQGWAGRFTYNYKQKYLFDFNFGVNGSENFARGHRYGFFPAWSAGWVPSLEDFWNIDTIDHLKIRGSYGFVGNDAVGGSRFFYMSTVNKTANGYLFGDSQGFMNGMAELQMGAPNATWEVSQKTDVGIDIEMFDRKLRISADYFYEYRDKILLKRATIPDIMGAAWGDTPWANIGIMTNKGIDGQIEFTDTTPSGFFYSIRGNFTYAQNKIVEDDTAYALYDYQNSRGMYVGSWLGYTAIGLFQSQDEIDNSPIQELGSYTVGDIKYKDTNKDGYINAYDREWIGRPREPQLMFGFGMTFAYKGFDLALNFTGAALSDILIDSNSMWPFALDYPGYNVLREYYDHRFIPGATDNSKAKYPVVHNSTSANNYTINTLYQHDASYLKLKTAELGYNMPKRWFASTGLESIRVFFNGNNIFCLDKLKVVDPESNHLGAATYPTQRGLTLGFQLGF